MSSSSSSSLVAAAARPTSRSPQMNYYHGQNVPEGYITVLQGLGRRDRVPGSGSSSRQKQMYHLVLEGNEPVAEGWHSTLRAGGQVYTVTMKPKEGRTFEAGKTYRLCIGDAESPGGPDDLEQLRVHRRLHVRLPGEVLKGVPPGSDGSTGCSTGSSASSEVWCIMSS
ncbi:MAG: hypothetical protein MZV63_65615 [Marinilabiliales bacterium]|nr:hypothetical protein [Marinilabiliales bacterium]